MSYGRRRYVRGRFNARRTSYSGQSAAGNSRLWMRKKPFNKKAYSRKLFNASSDATKYRSMFSATSTDLAPANSADSRVDAFLALSPNFFLSGAGGLNPAFVTIADVGDKVFVRGGTLRLTVTNDPGDADNLVPIRVRLWYGWLKNADFATFNTRFSIAAVANSWDPTLQTDWQNLISISDYTEKALLISDSITWEHKLRPFQFDVSSSASLRYKVPYYIMQVNALSSTTAPTTISYNNSWNVSFTADARV